MAGLVSPARAQERFPATVTSGVDGDTVDAQVSGGPALRVRLIGIDTPERGECGTDQATAYMEQLALGRNVTLVSDPTQDALTASVVPRLSAELHGKQERALGYLDFGTGTARPTTRRRLPRAHAATHV
jgi:hypothetical protein